jgi:hypothetical protein
MIALADSIRLVNPDPNAACVMVYRVDNHRLDCDVIVEMPEGDVLVADISIDRAGGVKVKHHP